MALKITDDCIACGACEPECPLSAISESGDIFVIDWQRCVECVGYFEHTQCADVCPVDACVCDPEHREEEAELLQKVKRLVPDLALDENNFASHFQGKN